MFNSKKVVAKTLKLCYYIRVNVKISTIVIYKLKEVTKVDNINNVNPAENEGIDLVELAKVVLKKIWIPIIAAVAAAVLVFGYSEFILPAEYTSRTKIYVANASSDEMSYSDVQLASRLANSYKEIFKSTTVCQNVADQLEGAYTAKQINSMVNVTTSSDSEIISLSVTCNNAKDAQIIASYVFQYGRQEIMRVIRAGWVEYIDEPSLPEAKSGPASKRDALFAGVAAAAVACGIIIVMHLLSNKIKSKKDLSDTFSDIPVIGVIPVIKK